MKNNLGPRISFRKNSPEYLKNSLEEALIWGNLLCEKIENDSNDHSLIEAFNKFKKRIIRKQ